MAHFRELIEVNVLPQRAFAVWDDFVGLPRFLRRLQAVQQVDGGRFRCEGLGSDEQRFWEVQVIDRAENDHLIWQRVDGPREEWTVSFMQLASQRTLVTVEVDAEHIAAGSYADPNELRAGLDAFRQFVEG